MLKSIKNIAIVVLTLVFVAVMAIGCDGNISDGGTGTTALPSTSAPSRPRTLPCDNQVLLRSCLRLLWGSALELRVHNIITYVVNNSLC